MTTDPFNPQSCRIALLVGGASNEREISLSSGRGVEEALSEAGFCPTVLDPSRKEDLKALIDGNFDVAFISLHGRFGEDGTIQGFLELIGVPYVGSGVWSSALAMDKAKSKTFYTLAGLKTPQSLTLNAAEEATVQEIVAQVGERCVVKPVVGGSALGIMIVEGEEELRAALGQAFSFGGEILVETYIEGDEYTVAVLGNDEAYTLPVIQIVPTHEFYDFESKYTPGGSQHICPAPLDSHQTAQLQKMALEAHRVLGCRGVSRSDFLRDGQGDFWILETNTIPGMTETSLLPDAARKAGIEFPELCTLLVRMALEPGR